MKGNGGYTDVKGPLTSEYERFWKRCSRYNIPDTWDSHVYIWSSIIPCLIGLGCMITSLIVTYLPGHRKRNFIDALSGERSLALFSCFFVRTEKCKCERKKLNGAQISNFVLIFRFCRFLSCNQLPYNYKLNYCSGKHNFTTADLEELVKAAKSISIVTMICTIIPAVENLHTFIPTISPSFLEAAEEIFGMVNYYWWVELVSIFSFYFSRITVIL